MIKKASIFDKPQSNLNAEIFDQYTKQMLPRVRLSILNQLVDLVPPNFLPNLQSVILMGSITGYQYSTTSDVDVQIGLTNEDAQAIPWKDIKYKNGRLLTGTKHPINFNLREIFPPRPGEEIEYPVSYDLIGDRWLKEPIHPSERDLSIYQMDLPYLRLLATGIGRQIAQMEKAYGTSRLKDEAQDLADAYHSLDSDRKTVFRYASEPKKTTQDFAYKYIEHKLPHGDRLDEIERILRRKYNVPE